MTDRLTLFCFSCAGASAAAFRRWRRHAPSWLDVVPVERPGRGHRAAERHQRDFLTLVQALTHQIGPSLPARYALFGHSLGALLAFGCAHQLGHLGYHRPCALAVAGSAAPSRRDDGPLAQLTTDQQLIDELRRQNGTPAEVFLDPEMLRFTLDTIAADFALCSSFRYDAATPLNIPICVFGGRQDDIEEDEFSAWAAETTSETTYAFFDGDHFFFRDREPEFVRILAQRLCTATGAECGEAIESRA